jgi:hypothetical protein
LTPANLALAASDIPILNLTPDGKPLAFPLALSGPDRQAWIGRDIDIAELRKLLVTFKCLVPSLSPAKKPTHYKRVVKEKWDYEALKIKRRARGAAGGDRLECPCSCATPTASMTLVKCHLNAVVSENAHFGTLDITDYYLGADMPEEDIQSLKMHLDDYPHSLLDELGLTDSLQQDRTGKTFVYANIVKTVPGLKNSGLSSQNRLVRHLASCGHHQTATPMLFRYQSRDVSFTLLVGDFGVKCRYTSLGDFHHLQTPLELLHSVTSSPTGTRCLGSDIDYDRPNRIMSLSLDGYIQKLLKSVAMLTGLPPI